MNIDSINPLESGITLKQSSLPCIILSTEAAYFLRSFQMANSTAVEQRVVDEGSPNIHGVDPFSGAFCTFIPIAELVGNNGLGPTLDLKVYHTSGAAPTTSKIVVSDLTMLIFTKTFYQHFRATISAKFT
ncbi:hypothetical protein D0N73_24665 [Pseudomonas fluorescens]|nr:hypothetical protein D0N73_24665 [Pseudomonas fluorescens]